MTQDRGGAGGDLLDELGRLWDRRDPVPADLADRIGVALLLRDLERQLEPAGVLGRLGRPA